MFKVGDRVVLPAQKKPRVPAQRGKVLSVDKESETMVVLVDDADRLDDDLDGQVEVMYDDPNIKVDNTPPRGMLPPDKTGLPFTIANGGTYVVVQTLTDTRVSGLLYKIDGSVRTFSVKRTGDKFVLNTYGGPSGGDNMPFHLKDSVPGMPDFTDPPEPGKLWVPRRDILLWDLRGLSPAHRATARKEMRRLAKQGQPVWEDDWFFEPFEAIFVPHPFGHPSLAEDLNGEAHLYMTMMWLEALGFQYPKLTEKLIDISLNGY